MPLPLAGSHIDRDQALADQAVSGPVATIVVSSRQLHGKVREAQALVHGDLSPHPGIAGIRPGIVQPRIDPEFAGLGDRVEDPEAFARPRIESTDVTFDVALAARRASAAVRRSDD